MAASRMFSGNHSENARPERARERLAQLAVSLIANDDVLKAELDHLRPEMVAARAAISKEALFALVNQKGALPPWDAVRHFAVNLGASKVMCDAFRGAHKAALEAGTDENRPRAVGRFIPTGVGRKVVPSAVEDLRGHECKPNPLDAQSFAELEEKLREYWHWAGRPGSRVIAAASGDAFSHGTIAKLLSNKPGKPSSLKQSYVRGLIRGCGGDDKEQQRWVTAWRRIDRVDRVDRAWKSVT